MEVVNRRFNMADALASARRISWALRTLNAKEQPGWKMPCLGSTHIFYDHTRKAEALNLCANCPVRVSCAVRTWADEFRIARHEIAGVRAGLLPIERLAVRAENDKVMP